MVDVEQKQPKKPNGLASRDQKRTLNRQPRGRKDGGRFADTVFSEASVDLAEGESVSDEWSPDESSAFEERMRLRAEREAEDLARHPRGVEEDADQERPLVEEDTNQECPLVEEEIAEAPKPRFPIKVGGVEESPLGSWNYPPSVGVGYEALAQFWATVKLNDSVISAIEIADHWGRDPDVALRHDEELEKQLQRPNGWSSRQRRKDPEGYEKDRALRGSLDLEHDWIVAHAGIIPQSKYRDITRIGAYWAQIGHLDETRGGEPGKVLFEMSSGERVTAPEIWDRYRLWEIEDAWST